MADNETQSDPAAQPEPQGRTRRGLLGGLAAGVTGVAAGQVAGASPAQAADGDPMVLGQTNEAESSTTLITSGSNGFFVEKSGTGGVAVIASHFDGGVGLRVQGKVSFPSSSGRATVPEGANRVIVPVSGLVPTSDVLATAQRRAGNCAVQSAVPRRDEFTVWLTKPAPIGGMPVAWFVLD